MMLINGEWCFIHIPKNSGTNLKKVFSGSDNRVEYFIRNRVKDSTGQLSKIQTHVVDDATYQHSPLFLWQELNIVKEQKIFTISRNPFTRFVSYCSQLKSLAGLLVPEMSLTEFIHSEYLDKTLQFLPKNITYNYNQVDYLLNRDGKIVLDKFYKLEDGLLDLQDDFKLTNINTFMYNSGNYQKDYSKIYTDTTIKLVQSIFQKDFEYFKYSNLPFW